MFTLVFKKMFVKYIRGESNLLQNYRFVSYINSRHIKSAKTSEISPEINLKLKIPFSKAKLGLFFQEEPLIGNQYLQDSFLRSYLKRIVPSKVFQEWEDDLKKFGNRVALDINKLGQECELNPPSVIHQNAWGKQINHIIVCDAWKKMHDISAEEGLIAIAYERKYGQWSRIYQMMKNYLYAPSSGLYSCPLAMTDGAAKVLENLGISSLKPAFDHLISRNKETFWTSGQWMTERKGGSDVGTGTETVAILQPEGHYLLYGYKWFSSATDSDMALTLARIVDENGEKEKASEGLSLFYLETKDTNGNLNNIDVIRLKNKLGTRQLPTAELLLDGTMAYKISEEGRGVSGISCMLNITRIHNAISSVAGMRRIVNLARDYSTKRSVFGKLLCHHSLHVQTLSRMEVETRGCFVLVMEVIRLLGLEDCNMLKGKEAHLFRILTPLCKLYSAKQAIVVISEGLECFGGQGYIEDTGLPVLLRDAQVLPIWEGTTNVLSLDVLRCLVKSEGQTLVELHKDVLSKIQSAQQKLELQASVGCVQKAIRTIVNFAQTHSSQLETAARDFSFSLARTYIGALLLDHASSLEASPQDITTANMWCQQNLASVSQGMLFEDYEDSKCRDKLSLLMQGFNSSA